jgi:hypothetical protein
MAAKPPILVLAVAMLAIFAQTTLASHTPSNTTTTTATTIPGGPNPKIGQSAKYDICKPKPEDCQAPPQGAETQPGVAPVPEWYEPEDLCWYKGVWYLSNNNKGSRTWWYWFAEDLNQYCCPPFGNRRSALWSKDECKLE